MNLQGRMRRIVSYLKFLGGILAILLVVLGFVLVLGIPEFPEWLGQLDWYDTIGEVIMRAIMLFLIVLVAASLMTGDSPHRSDRSFSFIVLLMALFGAAVLMTLWEQLGLFP